jgi:hypothetical protein
MLRDDQRGAVHVGEFLRFRHDKNLIAFCLRVYGFVRPTIVRDLKGKRVGVGDYQMIAAVRVWRLCQPNRQQPRIRSTEIDRFPCCEEFIAGSMVPIALTIKMIKRPNACSPRM